MIERLKICWYALTMKHYAFFATSGYKIFKDNNMEIHLTRRGRCKCYIESSAETDPLFLTAISDYATQVYHENCKNK